MVRTFVAFCCRRIPIMMKATMKLQSSHLWSQSFMKFEPSSARQDDSFQSLAKQNIFKVDGSVVERYGTWHRLGNPSDAKRKGLEAETFRNDSETRGNHQTSIINWSKVIHPKILIRKGLEADHFPTRFPDLPDLDHLYHLPKVTLRKGAQKSVVEVESAKNACNAWCRRHLWSPERERLGTEIRAPKPTFWPHWNRANQPTGSFEPQFGLGVRRNCLSGGLRRWGGGRGEY